MSKRKTNVSAVSPDAEKPCKELTGTESAPVATKNRCDENDGVSSKDRGDETTAENLALKAEIAGLRGELDAMRAREGELIRELDERRTPDYAAIASDEEFIDAYARRSELIKAKVIADYLRSLSHTGGVRLLGESVGKSALAPLKKPKTLSEAKKLAELYIKE
ncbi:MAG: hypothetical protein SPJ70_00945 [Candidatus Borkfalkiaceae bacterium]|nr:hypothetical protein [Christensenellaceae bacterium]